MRQLKVTKENTKNILSDLLKRSPNNYSEYDASVRAILDDVKERGDQALFEYTEKFDQCHLTADTVEVTEEEIEEAYRLVDDSLVDVIRKALVNIRKYHEEQKRNSWFDAKPDGTILGQKITPLQRVGVYVPGGKAAYPSSVLMNIVPAKVAGVDEIIMMTPPSKDGKVTPTTLVAAHEAGADKVFKIGGAQAIGALAYGTESIPKVDKIVGPGNIYVALAKKAVYGFVSIDSIAGPSEVLVLADGTSNAHYVAADLLSQAEHDELASAILVTTSKELADQVSVEIEGYLKTLSRADIIRKSLDNFGYQLIAENIDEAVDVVNNIAPEHLEIQTENPWEVMTKVRNAGAIFIGEYSSEPLGDYFAGPNHVLPTNGTAKFFSPLNVDDFIKKSSIIYYGRDALKNVHKDVETFAKAEHLTAHANSIAVRFEEDQD
ncbi:MAG: histidinol dehydrogenase [Lachnospiraceae bacterium]|nr:histidinol dehydrogenase [Lachnospiraceae bacterium]